MRNFIILIVLISVYGCGKNPPILILPNPPSLIFPVNGMDVDLLNVEFQWNLGSEEKAHFKLFLASNLEEAIVDSIVADEFFTVESLLPDENYTWILEFDDEILDATFTTRNPLESLKNQYEVTTHNSFRSLGGLLPPFDSTYIDTVDFILIKQGVNLKMSDNINVDLQYYNSYYLDEGEFLYLGPGNSGTQLRLNESLRKVFIKVQAPGLGAILKWETEFDY